MAFPGMNGKESQRSADETDSNNSQMDTSHRLNRVLEKIDTSAKGPAKTTGDRNGRTLCNITATFVTMSIS